MAEYLWNRCPCNRYSRCSYNFFCLFL